MKLSNLSVSRINQINLLFLITLVVVLCLSLFTDIARQALIIPGIIIAALSVVFFVISRRFLNLAM